MTFMLMHNKKFKLSLEDENINEEEILSDLSHGINYEINIVSKISHGSYGKIYQAYLLSLREYNLKRINIVTAIKIINKTISYGINCLLEYYIMLYIYDCNYLSKAIRINIDKFGNCHIIQPLAFCDMSYIIENHRISRITVKKWIWQLICAIAYLHSYGIIHCDIKCRNLLLFKSKITDNIEDMNLKLTDFSLSTLIINPMIGTKNNIAYTINHRPIEVFENNNISYSSDIWALGCTLFELYYGRPLFVHQNTNDKYILSIKNFIDIIENNDIVEEETFRKCNIDNDWYNEENICFNNLLLEMMKINPDERYTIWKLIEDPYFDEIRNNNDLPIRRYFPKFKFPNFDGDVVERYAMYLFHKSNKLFSIEDYISISKKILYTGYCYNNYDFLSYNGLIKEIEICKKLNFDFYPKSIL